MYTTIINNTQVDYNKYDIDCESIYLYSWAQWAYFLSEWIYKNKIKKEDIIDLDSYTDQETNDKVLVGNYSIYNMILAHILEPQKSIIIIH